MDRQPGDFGYVAFYKGKKMDVYAPSSYAAQKKAAAAFNAKKSYEVNVMLAERPDGSQVTHVPEGHVADLGRAPASAAERQRIRAGQLGNANRRPDPRLHAAHPAKQGGWKYQDDATEEEAAGYNARCDGEPITSNPFGSEKGDAYLSWRAGWLDANDSLAAHGVGESVEDLVTRILEVYDDGSIDAFTYGYLTAALRHSDGPDGLPLSRKFTVGDIAPECIDALEVDCLKFQEENPELKSEAAGYGFWSGHPVPLYAAEDGTVRCDDR